MNGRSLRIGVLGATGAVGRTMLHSLETSPLAGAIEELRLLASTRTAGTVLEWPAPPHPRTRSFTVSEVGAPSFDGLDLVLMSAGAEASARWAPCAVEAGAWVVDNSSRFRMDPAVALIVPEVNAHRLPELPQIIANPNCSTIQMVVALAPLHALSPLRRVQVCTYQSASGAGAKGVRELAGQIEPISLDPLVASGNTPAPAVFPHPLYANVIPQCDAFLEDGYTREEEKMIRETRKILELPGLIVQPTCVRVPVAVGHSEAVYVETESPVDLDALRDAWRRAPGVEVLDDPARALYPTPRAAAGTDPVWIGRLRRDRDVANGLHLWVVADNLRKGAARNAVQIAEALWTRAAIPSK